MGEQEVRILGLMRAVLLVWERGGGTPRQASRIWIGGKQIKERAVNLE